MDASQQESLFRWVVDTALAGGFLAALLKLRAERRLRSAQADSEEAQAGKAKSEAHRYDIESMANVVRSVKEQWVGEREQWESERGRWAVTEKLFEKQIADLAAEKRCAEIERDEMRRLLEGRGGNR